MADRGDTHYFTPTLNKWFLFSSLAFLGTSLWMMFADWNRPWKVHQREFRRVELAKAEQELAALETPEAKQGEAALTAAVEQARTAVAARGAEVEKAKAEEFAKKGHLYVKDQEAKFAKADYDWTRYLIEEHRREIGDPKADQDRLDRALDRIQETALAVEQSDLQYKEAQARTATLLEQQSAAEKALAASTRDQDRVRKRIDQLAPSDKAVVLANEIRDAPGLDFIGPFLKVQKVVLDNLTFELNFTKTKRVDMCTTCHLPADRAGFSDPTDLEPLRSHPRLDLYLSANSPHPLKDVGCTICHRGGGEALDFVRADHRPADEEQEHAWEEAHGWHKQHHWDYPMLSKGFVEASCVQCHKTSMELIADAAPQVTEGYRLFEKYGCYACHKVDWMPTSRRPGPSLKDIRSKVRPEFIAAWVANPKAFRPTTWMPQIFHLENFAAGEPVVKSDYGKGPDILGQQWNDTSVGAITAFLLAKAKEPKPEAVPVPGDAARGREVFRVSGCLACHNLAPYEGPGEEPKTKDLAFEKEGTNEHGPDLRGVATKVSREWLYAWIKDPKAYWPDTRMPNLRLSDQEASDIAAYMIDDPDGVFHDVPEGWAEAASPVDAEALREQARWFFNKLGRGELERRFQGGDPEHRWDDLEKLKVDVGEKLVQNQGCFSCHEIQGLESEMPIGTELSNWGSKTVDKLDFGFAAYKDLGGRPQLGHEYREGWLMRKLHAPRSFDLEKVKNPKERLRMPYFAFTDEEVQAISTFVVGLVDDEVQHARMVPTAEESSLDVGLRAIRQKNCAACHVLEPGTVTYRDENDVVRTVEGELTALESERMPPPMQSLAALEAWLDRYEKENDEEVDEIGFRVLSATPDVGIPGENVSVPRDKLVAVTPPDGGRFVRMVADYYLHGVQHFDPEAAADEAVTSVTADPDGEGKVQDVDGTFRAYSEEPYDKVRWTFAPPVLIEEGGKVQRSWFFSFLNDPVPLRKQIRVRMPTFHFAEGEAGAIADAFATRSMRSWPARYARTMRLGLGMKLQGDTEGGVRSWPQITARRESGGTLPIEEVAKATQLDVKVIRAIEAGARPETEASFAKVLAFGAERGFRMDGQVAPSYEELRRRGPSYLEGRRRALEAHGGPIELGRAVGLKGPNCYQCHWHEGEPPDQKDAPISWGPDLALTRERLREPWVEAWLWNPLLVYPGTSMPANFQGDPPQYQNVYPDSSNEQQIQAVLDWLFNMDRAAPLAE